MYGRSIIVSANLVWITKGWWVINMCFANKCINQNSWRENMYQCSLLFWFTSLFEISILIFCIKFFYDLNFHLNCRITLITLIFNITSCSNIQSWFKKLISINNFNIFQKMLIRVWQRLHLKFFFWLINDKHCKNYNFCLFIISKYQS